MCKCSFVYVVLIRDAPHRSCNQDGKGRSRTSRANVGPVRHSLSPSLMIENSWVIHSKFFFKTINFVNSFFSFIVQLSMELKGYSNPPLSLVFQIPPIKIAAIPVVPLTLWRSQHSNHCEVQLIQRCFGQQIWEDLIPGTKRFEQFKIAIFAKHELDYEVPLNDPTEAGWSKRYREARVARYWTAYDNYKTAWEQMEWSLSHILAYKKMKAILHMSLGEEGRRQLEQHLSEFGLSDYILITFHDTMHVIFAKEPSLKIERVALFAHH